MESINFLPGKTGSMAKEERRQEEVLVDGPEGKVVVSDKPIEDKPADVVVSLEGKPEGGLSEEDIQRIKEVYDE